MPMSRARSIVRSRQRRSRAHVHRGHRAARPRCSPPGGHFSTSFPTSATSGQGCSKATFPPSPFVKALAVVVWLIWLQLVWALVWEVAVNLRRVGDRQPPKPGPLVPVAVATGMSRLVAMIFSATVVVASLPAPVACWPATRGHLRRRDRAPALAAPFSDTVGGHRRALLGRAARGLAVADREMALGDGCDAPTRSSI